MARHLTLTTVADHLELSTYQVNKLINHYQELNTRYSNELVIYYNLLKKYHKGKITPSQLFLSDIDERNGVKFIHIYARYNNLPSDFKYFTLAKKSGTAVAHIAAMYGRLPKDFNQWDIRNRYYETVAHIAAKYKMLPDNFSQWELSDRLGWTVAHEYAYRGTTKLLARYAAKNDKILDRKDSDGVSVLDVLVEKGTAKKLFFTIKQLMKNNKD